MKLTTARGDRFFSGFSEEYTDNGLYEECLSWALSQIAAIDDIEKMELGSRKEQCFLISDKYSMAVYERSLRLKCEFCLLRCIFLLFYKYHITAEM